MAAVDFTEWAAADLVLTLGGKTYTVSPPSVDASAQILAAAVRAEVNLGLVDAEFPPELQEVLDGIKPGEHPALGAAWQQMHKDGVLPAVRDRMAYYAVFYWARGKDYADTLAKLLWGPVGSADAGEKPRPKARRRSRSSRRTA